jgi:hypothetical protein
MSRQAAERALVVSALIVAGTYTYRLVTEGHASSGGNLVGIGAPPNVGRFITGWGFAFFVLAVITEAAPPLGGSLSILVAAGDVLANAGQVANDVNTKVGAQTTPPVSGPPPAATPTHGPTPLPKAQVPR